MRGNNPAQISRINVNRWMGASPLNAGNITPPGAIKHLVGYDASATIMRRVKRTLTRVNQRISKSYLLRIKTPFFLLG